MLSRVVVAAALLCVAALLVPETAHAQDSDRRAPLEALWERFTDPIPEARPGVYWYFLDGNQSREAMTEDLESMAAAGIGHVIFLEVDLGIPRGPVEFMSEDWQSNFAHAVTEAERLGIELTLGAGPGWAGSGGPWIGPSESMKHLMASRTQVSGPSSFADTLAVPPPRPPSQFAGLSPELTAERQAWWRDVAVLAVPRRAVADTSQGCTIGNLDVKALFETQPYSIWKDVPRYVPAPEGDAGEGACASAVDPEEIVNLTGRMDSTGQLAWKVPAGEWTIFRLVARSTGVTTRPAPRPGHGFEVDKLAPGAFAEQFESFHEPLIEEVRAEEQQQNGSTLIGGEAGWTRLHLDSWEMSSQNWTAGFRKAFRERRGYDPLPYLPAYYGAVIGSRDTTERFLWDVRKTAQELLLENYAQSIRDLAHEHGLRYSNQPYDMNPAGDIDVGAVADIPSCEFWAAGHSTDTVYGCLEAVSIGNVMGRGVVQAEAFTTMPSGLVYSPRRMKSQTDWAFAMGINALFFHTFTHQPLGDKAQPGMTLGPHGVHWHRNQAWWPWVRPYHEYVQRLSSLLRVGTAVSDILYLTPEGAPHIFLPPEDAMVGEGVMRYKRGYQFDAVTPRLLAEHAHVTDGGQIAFEKGGSSSYKVIVLPDQPTMTPETVAILERLVAEGATIIGNPPHRSPSLSGGAAADDTVRQRAARLWGLRNGNYRADGQQQWQEPPVIVAEEHGEGQIIWGAPLKAPSPAAYEDASENTSKKASSAAAAPPSRAGPPKDSLYTSYAQTARVLSEVMGVPADMTSNAALRFQHRRVGEADVYFLSNPADSLVEAAVTFRVQQDRAEVWDPHDATRRRVDVASVDGGTRRQVELSLGPFGATLVVFGGRPSAEALEVSKALPVQRTPLSESWQTVPIRGAWTVSFDSTKGGPQKDLRWERLVPWNDHAREGVRYYSGVARYTTSFDAPTAVLSKDAATAAIDLGDAYEVARVSVNGIVLDTLWTPPFRTPVPPALLKRRGNTLTVEVANNWNNRLVGDSRPSMPHRWLEFPSGLLGGGPVKAGWHTFTTSQWYSGAEELRPLQRSGLIGPVTLVVPQVQ